MHNATSTTLDDFSAYCDREYSPVYSSQLLRLLRRSQLTVDIVDVTSTQIELYFRRAGRQWSLSYLRKMHGAASVFFDWTASTGRTLLNPMQGTPRAIEYAPDKEQPPTPPIYLEYTQHLRNLNRSADTIVQRVGDIRRFAGDRDPLAMTAQDLGDYLREHRLDWAQEYRRKIRASFVSFYAWATKAGHIQIDPTLNLQSIRPGKPPRSPIAEVDLLEAFYSAEIEVQAIIALAASLGLRRSEISVLHTRDRNGRILTVHGKGDKVRFVPLNDLCYDLLLDLERKQGAGYYFRNKRTGHHLHPSTVYKHAKIYIGSWCLHSLRHRAATIGLRRGGNLRGIQELLGHLNLSTTQIYAEVSIEDIELITAKTSWPRSRNGEQSQAASILTVDLDNLSSSDVATLADALSRHLQEQAVAA